MQTIGWCVDIVRCSSMVRSRLSGIGNLALSDYRVLLVTVVVPLIHQNRNSSLAERRSVF